MMWNDEETKGETTVRRILRRRKDMIRSKRCAREITINQGDNRVVLFYDHEDNSDIDTDRHTR